MIETNPRKLVEQFPNRKILIVGDVMLDEYIWGEVSRISPEAPVPVVDMDTRTFLPGGAANTAANVSGLGGKAILTGVVGHDIQADLFREAIKEYGIDIHGLIEDPERPTTAKTRIVANSQQVVRVDIENRQPLSKSQQDTLLDWCQHQLEIVDSCILSDYEKGVITPSFSQAFIQQAAAAGKPVVVDPKGIDFSKYRGASIIKPNLQEAEQAIHHKIRTDADVLEAGRKLFSLLGGCAVLLTRGARGMSLFMNENDVIHIPTVARNVFDVTGAGDTVVSVMAMSLACGADLATAARLANHAAGIVVGKVGTAAIRWDELLNDHITE